MKPVQIFVVGLLFHIAAYNMYLVGLPEWFWWMSHTAICLYMVTFIWLVNDGWFSYFARVGFWLSLNSFFDELAGIGAQAYTGEYLFAPLLLLLALIDFKKWLYGIRGNKKPAA
jgi:hypothetical protein